ncbi:MAG: hypothetical protein R6U65_05635 [Perlabentimonas sp.]
MKFDNSDTAVKIQMQKRLVAVLVAVLVALIYFIPSFYNLFHSTLGISKVALTLIFLALFIFFYLYHLVAASSFFYYNDDDRKIIIRFYQLNMLDPSKNSFEIPKREFAGFTIKRKFKIRENLIVFRNYQGKIVNYPPVSISSLPSALRQKLIASLDKHSPKK